MPNNMGEYYERINDYDLEYQSQSELDIPFWRELMMRYTPQRVLELACGSGRIGIELLHSPGNFQLEGLDMLLKCSMPTGANWNASRKRYSSASCCMQVTCANFNLSTRDNLT